MAIDPLDDTSNDQKIKGWMKEDKIKAFVQPHDEPRPPRPKPVEEPDLYPKIEGSMKSWPAFFQAVIDGDKRHDFRSKKDRDFKVGQFWLLEEYDPFKGEYTGRKAVVRITYITSNDTPCAYSSAVLDRDAVVLSIKPVASPKNRKDLNA